MQNKNNKYDIKQYYSNTSNGNIDRGFKYAGRISSTHHYTISNQSTVKHQNYVIVLRPVLSSVV